MKELSSLGEPSDQVTCLTQEKEGEGKRRLCSESLGNQGVLREPNSAVS